MSDSALNKKLALVLWSKSPNKELQMSAEAGEVPRPKHAAMDVDGRLRTSMDGSPGRMPNHS
jgi:hypothetical protein